MTNLEYRKKIYREQYIRQKKIEENYVMKKIQIQIQKPIKNKHNEHNNKHNNEHNNEYSFYENYVMWLI